MLIITSYSFQVGLMRSGVLLCEETPMDLMAKNECDSMESAFLKLSYKQETNKDVSPSFQ